MILLILFSTYFLLWIFFEVYDCLQPYYYWRKKKKGINVIDMQTFSPRLCRYFSPDFVKIGELGKMKEYTDRVSIYKHFAVSDEFNANKYTMYLWDFVGFTNEKPVKDCSYKEFKKIYKRHIVYNFLKP